jgi:dipeptidyl aminopeptidase/acylaminoacyl peptidase
MILSSKSARLLTLALVATLGLVLYSDDSYAGVNIPQPEEKIVYQCRGAQGGWDICMIDPDGGGFERLTNDTTEDRWPRISPDGSTIVWRRDTLQLWTMNVDGSNKQELLPDITAHFSSPTWSPDGGQIAFICNDPNDLSTDGICTINRNGSGFQMIEVIDPRPTNLEWSPDGTRMLVEIETQSINEDIFIYTLSSGSLENITETGDEWEHGTWSPDSQHIAFVGTPLPGEPVSLAGLYVMDADGDNRENLHTDPQSASASSPAWSPDGETIAFFCAFREVCLVDPAGNLVDTLTEDFEDKYYLGDTPDWGLTGGTPQGDIDCGGTADPIDALKLLRYDAGLNVDPGANCVALGDEVELGGAIFAWGDIDCDGLIGPIDGLKVLRFDAGLDVTQEEDCPPMGSILT